MQEGRKLGKPAEKSESANKDNVDSNNNFKDVVGICTNTDDQNLLCENDNNDMLKILNNVFPPDLQFQKKNGEIGLIGFTEVVPESIVFDQMNKTERISATDMFQLVFLGSTGFRFPFEHFPLGTASCHELYLLLSVNMLLNFEFIIQYASTERA
ncbi:hypothetical protein KUTeg_015060 [Tegillarca granosa]|uniref:Uncharacterized protein n=1 Tax=Tegillarca granosa TaxID=220873 RepID=A0ABQ9ERH2_TEGGR|nr:hypothetical protein KUTeg_015060 [Tegillarca granosa]